MEIWIFQKNQPSPAYRIWPSPTAIPEGFIKETGEYVVEGSGNSAEEMELRIEDQPLVALRSPRPGKGRWLWSPGFYAGRVDITLTRAGKRIWSGQVILDPVLAKMTREQFDLMVKEILADTFALFAISSARKGIARGPGGQVPPIARLEFLRSRLEEIETAVREINASPVRILATHQQRVASGRPIRVSSKDVAISFRTETTCRLLKRSPLYDRFRGVFPTHLRITTRRTQLDIGEHRAIKAELRMWRAWLNMVAGNMESSPPANEDEQARNIRSSWVYRCRLMAQKLGILIILPVFQDVAEVNQPVTLTSVFRWATHYRKFFRLSSDFRMGLAKISGDFLNMPIARTFELYELWVFLKLIRSGTRIFGLEGLDISSLIKDAPASGSVCIPASFINVKLASNLILFLKKTFHEYWLTDPLGKPGSFSRKMVPDISLSFEQGEREKTALVVLDAKYRIDKELSGALASLHTYRDAIVQEGVEGSGPTRVVKGAYIITPHIPEAEITTGRRPWQEYVVPGLLFHPAYRKDFRFGALTMRPGMSDCEVDLAFEQILVDVGVPVPRKMDSSTLH